MTATLIMSPAVIMLSHDQTTAADHARHPVPPIMDMRGYDQIAYDTPIISDHAFRSLDDRR